MSGGFEPPGYNKELQCKKTKSISPTTIPTLRKPLMSVDLRTKDAVEAAFERSDTCVVPAAAVVGEAMLALVLADAFLDKFGGDTLDQTRSNFDRYRNSLKDY